MLNGSHCLRDSRQGFIFAKDDHPDKVEAGCSQQLCIKLPQTTGLCAYGVIRETAWLGAAPVSAEEVDNCQQDDGTQ